MSLTKTIIDLVELSGDGSEVQVRRDVIGDNGKTYQLQITAYEIVKEYEDEEHE